MLKIQFKKNIDCNIAYSWLTFQELFLKIIIIINSIFICSCISIRTEFVSVSCSFADFVVHFRKCLLTLQLLP